MISKVKKWAGVALKSLPFGRSLWQKTSTRQCSCTQADAPSHNAWNDQSNGSWNGVEQMSSTLSVTSDLSAMHSLRKNCSDPCSVTCSMPVLLLRQEKWQRLVEVFQDQNSCSGLHRHAVDRKLHRLGKTPSAQGRRQDAPATRLVGVIEILWAASGHQWMWMSTHCKNSQSPFFQNVTSTSESQGLRKII